MTTTNTTPQIEKKASLKTKKIKTRAPEPTQRVGDHSESLDKVVPESPVSVQDETPVSDQPETQVSDQPETVESEMTFQQILLEISEQRKCVRDAEMKISKMLKTLAVVVKKESKKSRKHKSDKPAVKREQKKRPVIDSLAELMGVDKGSEYSRAEIQSFICKYIREHELQSKDDKKCFDTDSSLERVLGKPRFSAYEKNTDIRHSYNNLMKVLGDLFVREQPELST
jgi:chromatin remodeling complex protein RSC6